MDVPEFIIGAIAGAILPTIFFVVRRRWERQDLERVIHQQHIDAIHALVTRTNHFYHLQRSMKSTKSEIEAMIKGVAPEDAPTHPARGTVLALTEQLKRESERYMALSTDELGEEGKWNLSFKYLDDEKLSKAWKKHQEIWRANPENFDELYDVLDEMLERLAELQKRL